MNKVKKLLAAAGVAAALALSVPTAASASPLPVHEGTTTVSATSASSVALSGGCVVGIKYETFYVPWSAVPYGAKATNCGKTTKKVQFIWKGGTRYPGCFTIKPGKSTEVQSMTSFSGYRICG